MFFDYIRFWARAQERWRHHNLLVFPNNKRTNHESFWVRFANCFVRSFNFQEPKKLSNFCGVRDGGEGVLSVGGVALPLLCCSCPKGALPSFSRTSSGRGRLSF